MKKVISFCLWGDNPTYNIGAIKNAELAYKYYPDFEYWYYIHTPTVPIETIKQLEQLQNVKIIKKYEDLSISKPLTWRFEPIDDPDVEVMISRDTDTRILLREKLAVDEWLQSGKIFHIMRDHPHHYNINQKIFAGMFGTKKIQNINWKTFCNMSIQVGTNYDQILLHNYIYPLIKNDVIVHTSFYLDLNELSYKFPIDFDNKYCFVGEYVYADESRSQFHIDELIKALNA